MLCGTVLNFWSFLAYRDVEWTFARFVGMLAIPGTMYFITAMLIPDDSNGVESWQEHYFRRRLQLFSGILGWGVLTFFNTTVVLGMPLTHPTRAVQLGMMMIGISGLSSARPVVHKVIAGCGLLAVLLFVLIVVARPIPTAG